MANYTSTITVWTHQRRGPLVRCPDVRWRAVLMYEIVTNPHGWRRYIAPLSSTVRFPAASTQLVWLVRQTPVKSVVPRLAMSKGSAAPNDARRNAGNARISLRSPDSGFNPVGSRVPITFVIPAARCSAVSISASNFVRSGTFAATVPPSAARAAFTAVVNSGAR